MMSYTLLKSRAIALVIALLSSITLQTADANAAKKKSPKGPNAQKVAIDLADKGKKAQLAGNLAESAKYYSQAFNVRYRNFGHKDPQTVVVATKLAELYRLQKDYKKSEEFLLWSMKALVRQHGFYSDKQIPVLNEYVKFFSETKKFEKAIEKQKIIVSMLEKKDDSNPLIYPEKVELAELMAKNADYNDAAYQLKDADSLASDYEYKPSKETLEYVQKVKGYISEKPFKKIVIAPSRITQKPEKSKIADKPKVSLPKVDLNKKNKVASAKSKTTSPAKVKNASFASTNYNITPTSLDKLDEKVVANGPLEKERTMLLKFIAKSQRYGIGVRNYVDAFDRIEAMVKAEEPENVIKKRLDSLTSSLQDQFQRRYALSHRRPKKKKPKVGIGLVPNFHSKTNPERPFKYD